MQLLKSPSARSKIIEVKVRGQIVQPATDGAIDLDLAARSPVNVMLTASSDADRAAWARAIHDRSVRRDRPFVAVSGRAFPAMNRSLRAEDVDEWFERSSGGTLFIDQVGELTLSAQTRLLSMLTAQSDHADEGAMSHTGHGVRVIAGSDRSLRTDLAYGAFSNELFYRLNLIHLDQMHEEDPEKMP